MSKTDTRPGPGGRRRPAHPAEIRSPAQFDAIASPVRDQILQVVVNQAPWSPDRPPGPGVSIREIGAQLGRPANALYRHVERLVEVGLIKEGEPEPSGGRDATTYRATGEVLHLIQPDRRGAALDALCRYHERAGAHAGRESAAAVRERVGMPDDGSPPDHGMVCMFGWLDDDQRARLREAMFAIADVFRDAARRPDTRLVAASLFIRPVRGAAEGKDEG